MKITLPLTLGLCALIPLAHADEELAPPDVDFYAEAQMMRADMDPYGFDTADGLNIKIGMWLNSVKLGKNSRFGLEGGFVSQSEVSNDSQFTRAPNPNNETLPGVTSVRVTDENSLDISGFTVGAIWQSPYWLYIRGGGYLYSFKLENRQDRILLDNNGDTVGPPVNGAPESDSQNGIAPYLGAGLAVPLLDNLSLTVDYQQTQLESESYGTTGIGLRYSN